MTQRSDGQGSPSETPLRVPLGLGLPLEEASFVSRPNQFTLVLQRGETRFRAAMADRGRLKEVLTPGRTILIEPRDGANRKTAFQALAARMMDGSLVSLNTQLPNRLVARALEARAIPGLPPFKSWRAEQKIGGSRFDFVLTLEDDARLILEIKSVGRIDDDDVARFPDAPTSRGARHVRELAHLASAPGTRCALLFVIQGEHASHVEIDTAIDPDFHAALCEASAAGVTLLAHACALEVEGLSWGGARVVAGVTRGAQK